MAESEVRLLALGDLHPDREDPETLFDGVRQLLEWADFRFGQLECTMSEQGVVRTDVRNPAHRVPPHNIRALTSAGIDLVSYAGNNNLDYGLAAFEDTLKRLDDASIRYVGAGMNLPEARAPVIVEIADMTVAFIDACAILRDGYGATEQRPGIAPLRVRTSYEPLENIYEQPGTPARTETRANHEDVASIVESIRFAKSNADICIALFHWGVHFTHDLATYQPVVGRAALDAGADIVIGTHPHCIQAIDLHDEKPIFYSLGNFAFEQDPTRASRGVSEYLSFYGLEMDSMPKHPHPPHCRWSIAVKILLRSGRISDVRVVPVYFADTVRPEVLMPNDEQFPASRSLIDNLCEEVGTGLTWEDGEGIVERVKRKPVDTLRLLERRQMSYPWLGRLYPDGRHRRTDD